MFNPGRCAECGTCLVQCPVVQYPAERAKDEVRQLKQGCNAPVLAACITCMACSEYCPGGADPFDLISRLQERHGVSLVSGARADMIEAMLGSAPGRTAPGDAALPALSLCVMEHAFPAHLAECGLFEGLAAVSGSPYYSRVVHLHTGRPSLTWKHAAEYIENLCRLGREKIVFAHDDCYVMAAALAPAAGIAVPFTAVHLAEWLGSVLAGKAGSIRKLGKKIAFQRPCIARLAPWTDAFVDAFFSRAGAERVSRRYDRKNARCCGIGLAEKFPDAGAEMVAANIADALEHGAEAIVFGCPSCYAFMSPTCMAAGLAPIFITDLALMALGEIPFEPRPHPGMRAEG